MGKILNSTSLCYSGSLLQVTEKSLSTIIFIDFFPDSVHVS